MANIREKQKDGKIFSFSFTACLERDAQGKQVRRYTTWTPPEGLTPSRARKAAERAADAWEDEVKAEYQEEKEAMAQGRAYMLPPEKRHDDFVRFVNETWFPLQVQGNNRKAKTVSFYSSMTKILNEYFQGRTLQGISPIDIQKYLVYLRTKYQGRFGRPLTPKTVHHQYNTLNLIFSFAEEQEMIAKNPMRKVEAPKKQKKAVDALTEEQAQRLFGLLPTCPLDFHCILQLLVTTGMRRGECMGLKWRDIDESACTLSIERNVSYTPESGVIVSTPKTANSIRTIPIMPSTLQLLQQLKQETQQQHPSTDLKDAFLFPKGNEIFIARDPNSVTFTLRDNGYEAVVHGRAVHVDRMGDLWKYSVQIAPEDDEDRLEYLQIVYDRVPTLAVGIRTSAIKELLIFARKKTSSSQPANRRLPRIAMEYGAVTSDGVSVTVLDFNYQYITVAGLGGQPRAQLEFAPDVLLDIERVEGRKNELYLIKNWEEISESPALRRALNAVMKGGVYEEAKTGAAV